MTVGVLSRKPKPVPLQPMTPVDEVLEEINDHISEVRRLSGVLAQKAREREEEEDDPGSS